MEYKDKIVFEISGKDYKNLKKFRNQHKKCVMGSFCDQFTYSFVPTGLGLAASVTCSCGQTLSLGNFLDKEPEEYDEDKCRVLTEADRMNKKFEEAALVILQLKDPGIFRMSFLRDQDFETIYAFSAGVASASDDRISKCMLYKRERGRMGEFIHNYESMDEKEKIRKFYDHFESGIKEEIAKYNCRNEQLLRYLSEEKEAN